LGPCGLIVLSLPGLLLLILIPFYVGLFTILRFFNTLPEVLTVLTFGIALYALPYGFVIGVLFKTKFLFPAAGTLFGSLG